jgi:hypothetical protein
MPRGAIAHRMVARGIGCRIEGREGAIAIFELGKRAPYARTLDDLRAALEAGGVEFTTVGGQPAVLKQR